MLLYLLFQYTADLHDPDRAQQFVCTVASSDATFLNRPQSNPTTENLVEYILKEEIVSTAHFGAYSGKYYNFIVPLDHFGCRPSAAAIFDRRN